MSDENLWGDEEEFRDRPEETKLDSNGLPQQSPPVSIQRPTSAQPARTQHVADVQAQYVEEEVEELEEESEETEEDYEDMLSDAHLRLEQGSLYKMIINQSLFQDLDADPRAIKNVEKEIRQFARERMEIMLGMRKETATVEHLEIDFPFNQKEVAVLKALARTATKGDSENSDRYVPEVTRTTEEVETVGTPRKQTLSPIKGSAPKKAMAPISKSRDAQKPLPKKPAAPLKRTKLQQTIEQIAAEEGVPVELLELNMPGVGGKPLHEMSESEVLERNRLIKERRGTQVKSASALPMATPDQEEAMALSRATQMSSSGLMSKIIEAAKNMPIKS